MVNCLMSICDLHRIRYAVLLLLLGVAMAGVQAQTVVADPDCAASRFFGVGDGIHGSYRPGAAVGQDSKNGKAAGADRRTRGEAG